MMNISLKIELIQLLLALTYIAIAWRKETHITRALFSAMSIALFVDVYLLQGEKPVWLWAILNIPFWILLYEKIIRKYALSAYYKALLFFMLVSDSE